MGFAKGVQITIADGTTRGIEDIRRGDLLMSSDGTKLSVDDVLCGMESELLQIMFKNEMLPPIRLMPTSIVVTSTGEKQAIELACGDTLQCESDGFAVIQELALLPNEDHVYHFSFNKKSTHFAGGIAVGSWESELEYIPTLSEDEQEQIKKELRNKGS